MKPVDIDRLFQLYIAQKLKEGVKPEQLEDEIPDLYLEWLEQPNEMLEGKSPGHLFDGWSGERLVEMLNTSCGDLVVTPKDVDAIADNCAAILSSGINMAIHDLSYDEAAEYQLSLS